MLDITELTCRVCLRDEDVLINIYDELEDLNTNLIILLATCADLQIYENDPFPKYLCEDCTRELLITSKFREKCFKSKETLCKMLENSKILDLEKWSNSSDLIEYCSEDAVGGVESNYIVQEYTTNNENVVDNGEFVADQVCPVPGKSVKLSPHPLQETIMEEIILKGNYSNQIQLETEDCENVLLKNSSITVQEFPQNHLFNKKQIEKAKISITFKCDICGALFKQAMNLQKHLRNSHEIDHCFICNRCSHCSSSETEFHKHVENCTYVKIISEKNSVNKTVNNDAISETECARRKCIHCGRTFSTPFALRMHLRIHTGERPFKCKYCTKSFKTQSHLNVHHKRHIGQADFICTLCNKSFYEQSNLSVHMRSHTGERPHVCSICNKTFGRVFLLQFHMRTHTGEKPFDCTFCGRSFRQHADLRNHLAIHTGKKQNKCNLCGKCYIKRSHLVQHMCKHQIITNTTDTDGTIEFEEQNFHHNSEGLHSFNDIIGRDDFFSKHDKVG